MAKGIRLKRIVLLGMIFLLFFTSKGFVLEDGSLCNGLPSSVLNKIKII